MFYRYEAKNADGEWEGIFSFFNPDHRRYFNRFLREPKWYEKNWQLPSKCWFTEEGYQKYHSVMEYLISWAGIKDVRVLTQDKLGFIACKGKIQCIEADGWRMVPFAEVKRGDQFMLHSVRRVAYEDTQWTDGPFVRELELQYTGLREGEQHLIGLCYSTDFPTGTVIVFNN